MDITLKSTVLVLNKNWMPVNITTIKDSIIGLASSAFEALDISYLDNSIDKPIMIPTKWENWINLPVRAQDIAVHYANGNKSMRAPTVIIAINYTHIPFKKFDNKNPSKNLVGMRDNWTDQYTGQKLKKDESSLDHVIPKSRGGKDTWDNVVITHKKNNAKKGNKLNEEIGFKLLKKPRRPLPIPFSALIKEIKHKDWLLFVK